MGLRAPGFKRAAEEDERRPVGQPLSHPAAVLALLVSLATTDGAGVLGDPSTYEQVRRYLGRHAADAALVCYTVTRIRKGKGTVYQGYRVRRSHHLRASAHVVIPADGRVSRQDGEMVIHGTYVPMRPSPNGADRVPGTFLYLPPSSLSTVADLVPIVPIEAGDSLKKVRC